MGFLSGVLNEVKNDPSVTTYYNDMETTLETIKSSMHKPNGLSKAVDAVSRALGEWDGNLSAKIQHFKNTLITLTDYNMNNMSISLNSLKDCDPGDVADRLLKCALRAGELGDAFKASETEYSKLDSSLKRKIRDHLRKVEIEIKTFTAAASNDELKLLIEMAEQQLEILNDYAITRTTFHLGVVVNFMEHRMRNMKNYLEKLLNREFEATYKAITMGLQPAFQTVHCWIDNVDSRYKKEIVVGVENIYKAAVTIQKLIIKEKENLKHLVEEIGDLVGAFQTANVTANREVIYDLNYFQNALDLRKNISALIRQITTNIQGYAKSVLPGKIKKAIKKQTARIAEGDSDDEDSDGVLTQPALLDIVETALISYGLKFKEGQFENQILQGWLDDILAKNGVGIEAVKEWIKQYAEGHRQLNLNENVVREKIKSHINAKIMSIIRGAISTAQGRIDADMTLNLTAVKDVCKAFADNLGKQVVKGDISYSSGGTFIKSIVDAIEHEVGAAGLSPPFKSTLHEIIKTTVIALCSKAKQVEQLLESFLDERGINIGNLTKACDLVTGLGKSIESELTLSRSSRTQNRTMGDEITVALVAAVSDEEVKNKLKELLREAVIRGIDLLDNRIESTIVKQLNTIKCNLETLQTDPDHELDTGALGGISDLQQQAKALEDHIQLFFTNTVGESKNPVNISVHHNLVTLQSHVQKLSKEVQNVHTNINAVGEEIEKCIVDTKDSLNETPKWVESIMIQLQNEINEKIVATTEEIQNKARKDYLVKIGRIYMHMERNVNRTVSDITEQVEIDLNNGVKGLLKRVMDKDNAFSGLDNKLKKLDVKNIGDIQAQERCRSISGKLQEYLDDILVYIFYSVGTGRTDDPATNVKKIQHNLDNVLTHLSNEITSKIFTFDSKFRSHLHDLTTYLSTFNAAAFANPHHPQLLDALKAGMKGLVKEMEKAYVNRYCGAKDIEKWEKDETKTVDNKKKTFKVLTSDATRCAKVFMSCLPMWVEDLGELKRRCEHSWSKRAIHLKDEIEKENPLGEFLKQCGYRVPTSQKSHQDGELQCHKDMTGKQIHVHLVTSLTDTYNNSHLNICVKEKCYKDQAAKTMFHVMDLLDCLYSHLDGYNEVGHLSTLFSKKHPCSVYEMLVWLSGLTHNPIYSATRDARVFEILDELNKDEERKADEEEPHAGDFIQVSYLNPEDVSLNAHPRKIPYKDICDAVTYICANAYDVLTTIAGTGDEHTTYASDLSNNSMKFHYPQSGEDCFDMLLDILRRLFPPLKFLLSQCSYAAYNFGWRDCMYGKDIASGKSQCIDHSEDKAACQPKGKPNYQLKCQVNSQANCRPTSPLMSYLNDCLPGHLPHQLSKIGCRYECVNCPSTARRGMPCITPLGFRGFSGSTKKGGEICHILRQFFANTNLMGLLCLVPKPPSTISEHFSFVQSLANSCVSSKSMNLINLRSEFESSIDKLSIQLQPDRTVFTEALLDAYGSKSAPHTDCEHPHLTTLTTTDTCKGKANKTESAPFMYPLAEDAYCYFAMKHCDTYVSWAVYLPWTFWQYLNNLCDDFCNIFCADWGCRSCLNSGKCKRGEHGKSDEAKEGQQPNHHCKCESMVKCKGVSPTFYRYGFAFGDPTTLNTGKQCHDFYNQLTAVLKSHYFQNLFDKCDDFLFKIREPFIWLNVALWLLSFLYLLHIMVIRLDLLHIKSHLHSPSSHRIAAQSLLAAGRVNKLNRVFYLQP